jgi:hypothetical protein
MADIRTRRICVVAQDPGVCSADGAIVTAELTVPAESLGAGPVGHRVQVVDYDSSSRTLYGQTDLLPADGKTPTKRAILEDPAFHAQNVYSLVMATLGRFEFALGRRVGWSFDTHQIKVVPHAFEAANAFYSPECEALLFGYFRRDAGKIFTCLSHDIVVHETTHALLDGLRPQFMAPSSPDQAAFHEGYADVVSLLSVFSLRDVLSGFVDRTGEAAARAPRPGLIHRDLLKPENLCSSVLFGLAEEMEPQRAGARVNALRRSIQIAPDVNCLKTQEFQEPHRRGEVVVAAVMQAFLEVWAGRLATLFVGGAEYVDRGRVAEEGAGVADQLLTMMIRAIDYTPPIHLSFGDFLSSAVTADAEVRDDDSKYNLRATLLKWFAAYGIGPASGTQDGLWERSDLQLAREGVRFSSLQSDPTEIFRLIWENRGRLKLDVPAYTRVSSVRPCLRIGPEDGLPVRETVAECVQYLAIDASELHDYRLRKPDGMADTQKVVLRGGSTLVLDEYGMLKYEMHNRLPQGKDPAAQAAAQSRLDYAWDQGYFDDASTSARLSALHRRRVYDDSVPRREVW